MRLFLAFKNLLLPTLILASLSMSYNASAGLINSDFSDGLNGWNADIGYYDITNDIDDVLYDIDPASYNNNYSVNGNTVTLNTSFEDDQVDGIEHYDIYLFQLFEVNDNFKDISLDYSFDADLASVILINDSFDFIHDFANDKSFDLTAFSGLTIGLMFNVYDEYDLGNDLMNNSLTVSNIKISTTEVPEPSTFLIFFLALIMLMRKSKIS